MESFEEKRRKTAERLGVQIERIPRHIAVIMDGNGRWAQQRSLPRIEGHRQGGNTVEEVVLHSSDLGIETLTLYSFSVENWTRPIEEIKGLMLLYTQYLVSMRNMLMSNNIKLVHLGRQAGLPGGVLGELKATMQMTAGNSGMVLGLALNYGGRTELVDATRAIAQECREDRLRPEDIDADCIAAHLYTAGLADPDLLIRTANEMRISNFLLWQISYSEFYVTDTLWPDFSRADLDEAVNTYAKRDRRFGGINLQAPTPK
ncbi:MAG: isoprenyl transferase [Sedimentisphaerales bacterium]|nr:isoprenyl transferase [Sedimentisphaerales bacterium]